MQELTAPITAEEVFGQAPLAKFEALKERYEAKCVDVFKDL